MADLIDREALKEVLLERGFYPAIVKSVLESAQTVDAAEVVLCKGCVNYNTDNCCYGFGWCENLGIGVHDNFFCKIGERKNDG